MAHHNNQDEQQETPLQRHRRKIGPERKRRSDYIHRFRSDFGLGSKITRPDREALDHAVATALPPPVGTEDLVQNFLAAQELLSEGDKQKWRRERFRQARAALGCDHRSFALRHAHALRIVIPPVRDDQTTRLILGCDEIIRDAGIEVGKNPHLAFSEVDAQYDRLSRLWAAQDDKFRLCCSLLTRAQLHQSVLGLFPIASERIAVRYTQAAEQLAEAQHERTPRDLAWTILLHQTLGRKVKLFVQILRRSGSEIASDFERLQQLSDEIGTKSVRMSTALFAAHYRLGLAEIAGANNALKEKTQHLCAAEEWLAEVRRCRPELRVTPWTHLNYWAVKINVSLAQGLRGAIESDMDAFHDAAWEHKSLYHVRLWRDWRREYFGDYSTADLSWEGLRLASLLTLTYYEPELISRFVG